MTQRRLFVTTALPYANGTFHIGHIMEYIQADIWVRAMRMAGHTVHFVGADDAHGAPIMIAAEKAGKSPQQFVADIAAGRKPYLDGFHIAFDNWHSTDGPENHELAQAIYKDLKAAGLIETRTIEQFFDPGREEILGAAVPAVAERPDRARDPGRPHRLVGLDRDLAGDCAATGRRAITPEHGAPVPGGRRRGRGAQRSPAGPGPD